MTLLLAAALPLIWWTGSPGTAEQVRELRIAEFCVDADVVGQWQKIGAPVQTCSADGRKRALTPGVNTEVTVASATRSPWIDSNGWRFRRDPSAAWLYTATGNKAALAIAESFAYGVEAAVQTSSGNMPRASEMLRFLRDLGGAGPSQIADISFVDDGSAQSGEAMNLLNRRNILFRRVSPRERPEGKVVRIGSPDFPKSLVANPSEFAYTVRRWLGDDNRTLRIYGTENVLAHVTANRDSVRVHLLNYTANPIEGIRIRMKGKYTGVTLRAFDAEGSGPQDVSLTADAAEFTIPVMKEYGVIDLKR